jgi:protein-S-isoprenylcysteine O-methyltransferase Ste14
MIEPELARTALLLVPCLLLSVLWVAMRPSPREMTGAMLALLWNVPLILLVNVAAIRFGWWEFAAGERMLLGMPIDVLIGWAVFWGPVPAIALRRVNLWFVVGLFAWVDLLFMPRLEPLVVLGERWLIGEVAAIALCLVPGLLIARDTAGRSHLWRRAALQAIGYGGWLVFLLPAAAAEHDGIDVAAAIAGLNTMTVALWPLAFALLIGLAGWHEFVRVGGGTPIPFDPPERLVITGPYAYLGNPMQVSSVASLLLLAAWLGSWSLAAMAVSFVIYSVGLVRWHHHADIAVRFGAVWQAYRAAVPYWYPRWRPYVPAPATLYVAEACQTCQGFAAWLKRLNPAGLQVAAGEDHPSRDLEWITYRHADGRIEESGIVAIARALEHTNLALAVIGWAIRLPGIAAFSQLVLEAVMEKPMGTCMRRTPH